MIPGPLRTVARNLLVAVVAAALPAVYAPAQMQAPTQPANQPRLPKFETPVFINGQVLLEDGTPPAEEVRVELLCYGSVIRQVFASVTGDFDFELGEGSRSRLSATPMDASVSGDPSRGVTAGTYNTGIAPLGASLDRTSMLSQVVDLSGCEVRAVMAGYRSNSISLGRRRPLDNPDVGTLILSRLADVRGTTISVTSLSAPRKARKAYERAGKELRKETPDRGRAARELEKAVRIFPGYAAAWNRLGEVKLAQGDEEGARQAFGKAMETDPDYLPPCLSLASLDFQRQDWASVRSLTSRIIALDPNALRARFFHAVSSFFQGDIQAAEESLEVVYSSGQGDRYPLAYYLRAAVLIRQGRISQATAELRRYLAIVPRGPVAEKVRRQLELWKQQGLISDSDSAPGQ